MRAEVPKRKISIITATYNAAGQLRHCLSSIAQQSIGLATCGVTSFVDIEHIIVDGGSSDGTLAIIREYCSHSEDSFIRRYITEPDKGLYDALNKGLGLATGDIIGILHADDFYVDGKVLSRVAGVFKDSKVDACYGDLIYVTEKGVEQATARHHSSYLSKYGSTFRIVRYWHSGHFKPKMFYSGWMPPHPSFFVRRSAYERLGVFRLDLGTAADYELMLRFLLKNQLNVVYLPNVLVCMRMGGVSNASLANRLKAHRMDRRAWTVNGLKPYPWTLPLKPIRKIGQFFSRGPILTP